MISFSVFFLNKVCYLFQITLQRVKQRIPVNSSVKTSNISAQYNISSEPIPGNKSGDYLMMKNCCE